VTYICSDKTGTLTENKMRLEEIRGAGRQGAPADLPHEGRPWDNLFTALSVSNDATKSTDGSIQGDPTEAALLAGALAAGYDKSALERSLPRIAELAFDSDRRTMTTLHQAQDHVIAFVKGAPEDLLAHCTAMLGPDGEVPVPPEAARDAASMAEQGLRVLAFAFRRFPALPQPASPETVERELTLLGLAGLIDPPRQEARDAVAVAKQAGIVPVMITGDHPATAAAIARQLGIVSSDARVLTGTQLASLSQSGLEGQVKHVRVYARVYPAQKLRIVEALLRQ
jgi:Ca2+-transporting ATPase